MANVAIDPIVVHNWQWSGTTFTLRIFSDRSWVALDDIVVPGRGDSNNFYKEYTITVSSTDATIPAVTLASQTDSPNEKNARYTAYFYVDGVEKDMFLANTLGAFQVPDTPITTEWADLEQYNFGVSRRYYKDDNTYSALVIDQKIAASSAANFVDATTARKGVGLLDVAPVTPTSPTFVGLNSPLVTFTVNGKSGPYNLVGDGVADDTVGLNLALAQTGRIIEIPRGSFKFSSNLTSPVAVEIRGAGWEQTTLLPTAAVTSGLTLLTNTRLIRDFAIDGSATTNATGLTFGLHANEWGGQAFRIRSKNFTGTSGVGFRIADAVKGSFYGLLGDGSYVNMLIQRSGVSGSGGLPTTLDFYSCQLVNGVTNGLLVKGCELVKFFGLVAESNGAAGVRAAPTTDDVLDLQILSSYCEDNWHGSGSQTSNYSLEVDSSGGVRTARVAVRDTFFHAGAEKSVKFMGAGTVGNLLDNVQVYNTAGSIFADTGTSVTMNNFPANLLGDYSTIVTGSGIIINGVQPGTWTAWTPSYSTQSAMTFGTVTTTLARYKVIGKTCFVELSFVGTVGGTPSTFIVVSLPSGIVPAANTLVYTPSIRLDAARANSVVQTGGTDGLYFFYDAATTGVYTAGAGRGGAVSMAFEIN